MCVSVYISMGKSSLLSFCLCDVRFWRYSGALRTHCPFFLGCRQFQANPEPQQRKLIQCYIRKGYSHKEAASVVQLFSESPEVFCNILLMETKGITVPDASDSPFKSAVVMFVSFMIFGAIPVLSYAILGEFDKESTARDLEFILSMVLTGLALFALGAVKVRALLCFLAAAYVGAPP